MMFDFFSQLGNRIDQRRRQRRATYNMHHNIDDIIREHNHVAFRAADFQTFSRTPQLGPRLSYAKHPKKPGPPTQKLSTTRKFT